MLDKIHGAEQIEELENYLTTVGREKLLSETIDAAYTRYLYSDLKYPALTRRNFNDRCYLLFSLYPNRRRSPYRFMIVPKIEY